MHTTTHHRANHRRSAFCCIPRSRLPGAFALLCLLLFMCITSTPHAEENKDNAEANRRIVIAHCMNCCTRSVSFRASEKEKADTNGVSWWKMPVGGSLPEMDKYAFDPHGAARKEIELAKRAGIDAFGMFNNACIKGPLKQFAAQTESYWQAALEDGTFKVFPEFWILNDKPFLDSGPQELQYYLDNYDDAWLRIDGKRVVFFANQKNFLPKGVEPEEAINQILKPLGGKDNVYVAIIGSPRNEDYDYKYAWRRQPPEAGWVNASDAMIYWWCLNYGGELKTRPAMDNYVSAMNKEEWIRIMPSFFALRDSWGPWIEERLGFAGFYENWQQAIRRKSRVAYIVTWNDTSEDSGIMPDVNHGYAYLELNRYFSRWYKAGAKPTVEDEQVLLFHHPQLTETPMKFPEGVEPVKRHNAQATPPTDYIGIVTMLKEEATVRIDLRTGAYYETMIEKKFPAGVNFWLLYHPLNSPDESALKNNDEANVPEPVFPNPIYPQEQADFQITKLDYALKSREIYIGVVRDGTLAGYFRSSQPILGTDRKPNLCTVGNVFKLEK